MGAHNTNSATAFMGDLDALALELTFARNARTATAGKHRPAVICEGVGGMDGLVRKPHPAVSRASVNPFS